MLETMDSRIKRAGNQQLAQLQNEFLLLFLKYKLSFRFNQQEVRETLFMDDEKKRILAHCLLHAVFNNSTRENPRVSLKIKQEGSKVWLEINSSGEAKTFFKAIDEYCEDLLLMEYLKFADLTPEVSRVLKASLNIEPDQQNQGSVIRWALT